MRKHKGGPPPPPHFVTSSTNATHSISLRNQLASNCRNNSQSGPTLKKIHAISAVIFLVSSRLNYKDEIIPNERRRFFDSGPNTFADRIYVQQKHQMLTNSSKVLRTKE